MRIHTILGKKQEAFQAFLEDGRRIPVTKITVKPSIVTQVKIPQTDGYAAVQLGLTGKRKKGSKPVIGHLKKALEAAGGKILSGEMILREVRLDNVDGLGVGQLLNVQDVIKEGDLVNVTGTSKGKGFAGVVKRWGFKGGPRTHGQSDRERAPGSIGQTTTPGRVYKGKKMAGRLGGKTVTIRNLMVVRVTQDGEVWVTGQVPGAREGVVKVHKVGEGVFTGLSGENTGGTQPPPADTKTPTDAQPGKEEPRKGNDADGS